MKKVRNKIISFEEERNMTDWAAFAYSAAVTAGGLIGYVKKGSVASGLMGLSFGALAGFGAW